MAIVTIIGAGMMGSALAFPARENGNQVRLVGTPLDREIIETCKSTGKHPKLPLPFPAGVEYYQIEDVFTALENSDVVIGGVSSFGVSWFSDEILPILPDGMKVLTVTKGLMDTDDGKLITYPALWQQKLDAILGNPEMMAQLMKMAQSLGGASPPPPPQQEVSNTDLNIDAGMLQKIMGIAKQSGIDKNQQTLLRALSPYLSRERIGKLEKAMRAAKLAGLASTFLGSGLLFQTGR